MAAVCHADNISADKAASLAKSFFGISQTRGANGGVTLVWDGETAQTRATVAPSFYVFNRDGGGWVIIGGEDAGVPVLGYSETGSFNAEKMPSNITNWFNGYKRQVAFLRSRNIAQDPDVAAMWNESRLGESIRKATSKTLGTKKWGQDTPYNNMCPMVDGQQSVTGCVCTALCEIMRYHQWPTKGNGTLPSYSYTTDKNKTRTQSGHELTATYDWNNMPNSYSSYNSTQATNVAQLMFDVGVMIQSAYNGADGINTYGTGAFGQDVIPALVKYMDYDSSATFCYRDNYSTTRWAEMMRQEIDANRPMMYGGADKDGSGHEFVVDGYKSDNMFYINWGWDGEDNGFFAISNFKIDRDYDFTYGQDCIMGIQKNKGGHQVPLITMFNDSGKAGLSLKSGNVAKGENFTMTTGSIYNFGSFTFKADIAFALVDFAGNIREIISTPTAKTFDVYDEYGVNANLQCKFTVEPALGDNIILCYRIGGGDWIKLPIDGACTGLDEFAVFDLPAIKVNASATYSTTDIIPLKVVNVRIAPTSTKWYIDGAAYNDTEVMLAAGKHTVKCVATFSGRTETIVQVITVK